MDDEGQLSLGDMQHYLKYYRDEDGNYKLDISAGSIRFAATSISVEDAINEVKETISDVKVDSGIITATVEQIRSDTDDALKSVNETINELSEKVSLSLTPEQVDIAIDKKISQGVNSVTTTTGFTFDEYGLTVSKTGSQMTTQVTENGMTISRSGTEVLVVNNEGVVATNLHADTFLIIAGKARFEKYGNNRIGCFWIGG